ncbi:hypothetical protein BH23CHL5_BH23CHL5_23700 [soil metagenome]
MSSSKRFWHSRGHRALDAFWDSVVQRSPAEPIRPATIDAESASTIRQLHALAGEPTPVPEFEARLFAKLAAPIPEFRQPESAQFQPFDASQHHEENNMTPVTLAVPAPFPAPPHPVRLIDFRSRRALASLVAALLILLAGIGGYLTFYDRNDKQPAVIPAPAQESTPSQDVQMYRGNPARTGEMPGPGPEGEPVELWRFQTGGRITLGIAVVEGVIYVRSDDGVLHAIDAALGTELWSFLTGGGETHVAASRGMVYVGSDDGNIYAVDAASGDEQWRFAAGGRSSVTEPVEGVLYGSSNQGLAFALDAATGTEIWQTQVISANLRGPAVGDGILYYGGDDGTL